MEIMKIGAKIASFYTDFKPEEDLADCNQIKVLIIQFCATSRILKK